MMSEVSDAMEQRNPPLLWTMMIVDEKLEYFPHIVVIHFVLSDPIGMVLYFVASSHSFGFVILDNQSPPSVVVTCSCFQLVVPR